MMRGFGFGTRGFRVWGLGSMGLSCQGFGVWGLGVEGLISQASTARGYD